MAAAEKPPAQPPLSEIDKLQAEVLQQLRLLFQRYRNPLERKKKFEERLDFFSSAREDLRAAVQRAIEASVIEDRATYEQETLAAMEPLMKLKIDEPEMYRELQGKRASRRETNYPLLTELIGYEFGEDGWMRLHVPDQGGLSPFELYGRVRKSLEALAQYLKNHPEVPGVVGTSWLAADKHGASFLQRLGFTIEGLIDEEMRRTHFADEPRPVAHLRMSREEMLKRYGNG